MEPVIYTALRRVALIIELLINHQDSTLLSHKEKKVFGNHSLFSFREFGISVFPYRLLVVFFPFIDKIPGCVSTFFLYQPLDSQKRTSQGVPDGTAVNF